MSDLFKSSHLFCQQPCLRDEMIFIQIQYQNIKPNTIISNITSALPLTQYTESTYPLTSQSSKSAPYVPELCCFSPPYTLFKGIHHIPSISAHHKDVLFWHLYIAKVTLWGCQNTLSYCHEYQLLFFPYWKALRLSREKWLLINLPSLVAFSLRRTQCQLQYGLILKWF